MSGWTKVGDSFPGWLMQALNFGAAYPKGDEDRLFELGNLWKQAAADLEKLEPEIKSATDRVPQYYTGAGADAITKEFATLFDPNNDESIPKLVTSLKALGHDTRATAAEIEYTKIQSEIFAAMTLWTALSLTASLLGEAALPGYLAAARVALQKFTQASMKRILQIAERTGMKAIANSVDRAILVPLAKEMAAKPLLKYGIGGLTGGLMGAGMDAGIQGIQLMEGHLDDGFDLKKTFETGIQWGVGGLVGGPVSDLLGNRLKNNVEKMPWLTERKGGAIMGVGGGLAGAVGMYGAGLGTQLYDQKGDFTKVKYDFSPQLLAGGLGMGAMGGHKLELPKGTDGSTPVNTNTGPAKAAPNLAEISPTGEKPQGLQANPVGEQQHPQNEQVGKQVGDGQQPAGISNGSAPGGTPKGAEQVGAASNSGAANGAAEARPAGADTAKPGDAALKPGDNALKPGDAALKPGDNALKPGDNIAKANESGARPLGTERPGEAPANGAGPARPVSPENPAARPANENPSFAAGKQETAAPGGRGPEARPAPVTVAPEAQPSRVEPAARVSAPTSEPALRPAAVLPEGEPAKPSNPNRGPETPAGPAQEARSPAPAAVATVEPNRPIEPNKPIERNGDSPRPGEHNRASGDPNRQGPDKRGTPEANKDHNGDPTAPDPAIVPILDPVAEPVRPENPGPGGESPRGDQPRGTAGNVGDFRGDARPHGQPDLHRGELLHEINNNRDLLESGGRGPHEFPVVTWDPAGHFNVHLDENTHFKVTVDTGHLDRPDAVAEFYRNGDDYHVVVSDRARTEDITRAIAHELAEIQLEHNPDVLRDPTTERPNEMTTHLGGRFAELDVLTAQIDRALGDPNHIGELPGLRQDLTDLLDHLGVFDPNEGHKPWGLLLEHNPELAQRISDEGPHLPPVRNDHPFDHGSMPEEAFRRFDTYRNGADYGESQLGPIRDGLPHDEHESLVSYSRSSWVNDLLRTENPRDELAEQAKSFAQREAVMEVFGDDLYRPDIADLKAHLDRTDLSEQQRAAIERNQELLDEILDHPYMQGELNKIWTEASHYEKLQRELGTEPTIDSLRNYVDTLDRATAHQVPENLVAMRGANSFGFMRALDGERLGGRDPMQLIGTTQKDEGYLSTTLGPRSPGSHTYVMELEVPKGAHGIWLGKDSHHPGENELLFGRETKYTITDVIADPTDPEMKGVKYLVKATLVLDERELGPAWVEPAEPKQHSSPESKPIEAEALPAEEHSTPSPDEKPFNLSEETDPSLADPDHKPFNLSDENEPSPVPDKAFSSPDEVGTRPETSQHPEASQHPDSDGSTPQPAPSIEQPAAHPTLTTQNYLDGFGQMKELAARIETAVEDPSRAHELPDLRREFATVLDDLGLFDPATAEKPWRLLLERDPELANLLTAKPETFVPAKPEPGPHQPIHESPHDALGENPDDTPMVHSGGAIRPRDDYESFKWAEEAYEQFTTNDHDVADIAANLADHTRPDGSTFTQADIAQIKDHLFRQEHQIVDYDGTISNRRFDADPAIAEAWIRLRGGEPLPADFVLLEHELAESNYLHEHPDATYQDAHAHANMDHNWFEVMPERTGERYDTLWGKDDGAAGVLQPDSGLSDRGGVPVRGDEGKPLQNPDDRQSNPERPHGPTGGRDVSDGRGPDHEAGRPREDLAAERSDRLLDDETPAESDAEPREPAAEAEPESNDPADTHGTNESGDSSPREEQSEGSGERAKLRILTICDEWHENKGGVVAVNKNLAEGLADAGHEVFARVGHEVTGDENDGRVKLLGPREENPAIERRDQLTTDLDTLPPDIDVVIGHSRFSGPAAAEIRNALYPDAKLVHIVHMVTGELGHVQGKPESGLKHQQKEMELVANSDVAVGVGPTLADEAARLANMAGSEPVVHEMIPGVPFEDQVPKTPGEGPKKLLLFGRAEDAQKGAMQAAEMIRQLNGRGHDVELTVRGVPPEGLERAQQILSDAASRTVEVKPYTLDRAEILADMRDADVVIMPSRAEGFGLVATEAAGAGVPILVPSSSGVGKFIADPARFEGDFAHHNVVEQGVVDPVPVDRWVDKLDALLSDPEAAQARALELQEQLRDQNRTWQNAGESLVDTIHAMDAPEKSSAARPSGNESPEHHPATPKDADPRPESAAPQQTSMTPEGAPNRPEAEPAPTPHPDAGPNPAAAPHPGVEAPPEHSKFPSATTGDGDTALHPAEAGTPEQQNRPTPADETPSESSPAHPNGTESKPQETEQHPNQDDPHPDSDPRTPAHTPPDDPLSHYTERTPAGISLHDDPVMRDLAHRIPEDPRYITLDAHVNERGNFVIDGREYTPEEVAAHLHQLIGDDGRPIRLVGCDAATNDAAARLAHALNRDVLAPTKPAWSDSEGHLYTSTAEPHPDGTRRPRIPPDGEWETVHPDGTKAKASEDGFAPGAKEEDKYDVNPDDGRARAGSSPDPVREQQAKSMLGATADRVRDLNEWLEFHSLKANDEFLDALQELKEVKRQLEEHPTLNAKTALERNAPTHPSTGDPLPEFDIALVDQNDVVHRTVEVKAMDKVATKASDFTNGIHHGIDKVAQRDAVGLPIPRPRDVSIYTKIPEGIRRLKGLTIESFPDGGYVKRRPDGEIISGSESNIFDEVLDGLDPLNPKRIKNIDLLDKIDIIDLDKGRVLAQYTRDGREWRRTR